MVLLKAGGKRFHNWSHILEAHNQLVQNNNRIFGFYISISSYSGMDLRNGFKFLEYSLNKIWMSPSPQFVTLVN